MTYLKKITECHKMVEEGQMLEAFENFYHNDVVMVEATGEVRKGKDSMEHFKNNV